MDINIAFYIHYIKYVKADLNYIYITLYVYRYGSQLDINISLHIHYIK